MKEYIQLLLQLFVVSMQYTDATGKNLYIEPLFGRDFVYKFAKSAAKTPVFSSWALTLDGSLFLRMFFHLWTKPQHESWLPLEIWNSTSFVRARDSSTQPSKSLIIGQHFFFFLEYNNSNGLVVKPFIPKNQWHIILSGSFRWITKNLKYKKTLITERILV